VRESDVMRFVIHGPIVPFVHRTRQGKYSARAQRYHASQAAIGLQVKNQMQLNGWTMIEHGQPLALRIHVTRPRIHTLDATNLQKAIEDACNGIVFYDDRWVVDVHTTLEQGPEHHATLEVRKL
jgi:Holliday junction resolvase RusA-like endonuclease